MIFCTFQQTGDVVLVRGRDGSKLFNLVGQTLVRGKIAEYSHVLLCVIPGLYVHAMPRGGVHFVSTEDDEVRFSAVCSRWSARRNTTLSQADKVAILSAAIYFLGQDYNYLLTASTRHSYCSELIAKVFRKIMRDVIPRDQPPETAFPVDVAGATALPPWSDVTAEYESGLGDLSTNAWDEFDERVFREHFLNTVKIDMGFISCMLQLAQIEQGVANLSVGTPVDSEIRSDDYWFQGFVATLELIKALAQTEIEPPTIPQLSWLQAAYPNSIAGPSRDKISAVVKRLLTSYADVTAMQSNSIEAAYKTIAQHQSFGPEELVVVQKTLATLSTCFEPTADARLGEVEAMIADELAAFAPGTEPEQFAKLLADAVRTRVGVNASYGELRITATRLLESARRAGIIGGEIPP